MLANQRQQDYDRQIASWLLLCAAVIFGMIMLGGATRLTGSGLSMVEWKPLMGVIPPLGQEAWQEAFDKYKQYPEYLKVNRGMDLDGFKSIFMYEYLHRVLGRLIGVLFLRSHGVLCHEGASQGRRHAQTVDFVPDGRAAGLAGLVHGQKWPGR